MNREKINQGSFEKERKLFEPGQRVKILKVTTDETGNSAIEGLRNGKYLRQGMVKYAGRPGNSDIYEVILDEVGEVPLTDLENLRIEGRVTVRGEEIELLEE